MIEIWVSGIGVLAPGLQGWDEARAILAGARPYAERELRLDPPEILNPRERRRATPAVRIALNVAQQAVVQSGRRAAELAPVFGSANSDGDTLHNLLESLADPAGYVSPTQFHNSVHNAAIGYWTIGAGCHLAGTSIAAHDHTFAATLLKGALETRCNGNSVLVAVFDTPFPAPLHALRPLTAPFGVALVLNPTPVAESIARIELSWLSGADAAVTPPAHAGLQDLWRGNPAARSLPVLEALAAGRSGEFMLGCPDDARLLVTVGAG